MTARTHTHFHSRRKYTMNTWDTFYKHNACERSLSVMHSMVLNADAPLWRARGRRFFDSAVAASVFHEGPCFGPGWLFLRFNVSAFILGYRMRARFCNARDLSFLASREYISRAEARVRFVICGALGRSGCAKNGNTARRYPFNNYEFF